MTGRAGVRLATVLKPARLKVEALPVNTFDVLPGTALSTGYASSAGAPASLAARSAAAISADVTPRPRWLRRT
jgi:hypothetical protein